jgi:hypothetical protein
MWAGFVWGYALIWFLIEDQVKLGAYRAFGRDHGDLLSGLRSARFRSTRRRVTKL